MDTFKYSSILIICLIFLSKDEKLYADSKLKMKEILEKYIDICTIIFVDVQNEAIELWKELFKKGFSCCLLYGQMDQEDRIDNLEDFKKGKKNILVGSLDIILELDFLKLLIL